MVKTDLRKREKERQKLIDQGMSLKAASIEQRRQARVGKLEPALEEKKKVEKETFAKAEAEAEFQKRKKEREEKQEPVQAIPEVPATELKEPIPEQPLQEIDPVTGQPLLSGGVVPVTASDLTDVVTMFSGLGIVKVGGKTSFKTLLSKAGKSALPEAEAQFVKKGMVKTISKALSSKIVLFVGGAITAQIGGSLIKEFVSPYILDKITAEDRRIRSIDAGLSQVRETITLPIQLANANAPIEDCLEQIDDLRLIVEISDTKIKELEIESQEMKTNPEFTMPMKLRANKLRGFLDLAERQILIAQTQDRTITTEQLNELMETYEELFPNKNE